MIHSKREAKIAKQIPKCMCFVLQLLDIRALCTRFGLLKECDVTCTFQLYCQGKNRLLLKQDMSRPHVLLRSFKLLEIEIVILFDLHTYFI